MGDRVLPTLAVAVGLVLLIGVAVAAAGPLSPAVRGPDAVAVPVGVTRTIPGTSVSGFHDGEAVRVGVSVTSGSLSLPSTVTGVTVPAGYPALDTQASALAVEGTEDAVNAALSMLQWTPSAEGAATVTIDATPAGAAYDAGTGHYYRVVTNATPATWAQARAAAESTTFNGYAGYLATITNPAEEAFVSALTSSPAWFGATAGPSPGSWQWADGPETGTVFFDTTCPTGLQGQCGAGYAMWSANEPSSAPGYDVGIFGGETDGTWRAGAGDQALAAAIVEYGGAPGVAPLEEAHATTTLQAIVPPAAPAIGAPSGGTESATVTWNDTTGGGSRATAYVVTGAPTGSCLVSAPATACVVGGLQPGTAYQFRVAGLNDAGMGPWSDSSSPVVALYPATLQVTTTNANPSAGAAVGLVATAAGPDGAPRSPAGLVTFIDGDAILGQAAISNGVAKIVVDLPVGTHQVEATYAGDDLFGSAQSAALPITVAPAPPTVTTAVPPPDSTAPPAPSTSPSTVASAPVDGTTPPETSASEGTAVSAPTGAGAPVGGSTTAAGASTPTAAMATPGTTAAPPSGNDAPGGVSVVFDVGVGTELARARVTVRGDGLLPGSALTVTAHSTPVTLARLTVGPSGTVRWDGTLPADLVDGEHRVEVVGTGGNGAAVGRVSSFAVAGGVVSRIGAAPPPPDHAGTTVVAAPRLPAAAPSRSVPAPSSGGSSSLLPTWLIVVSVVPPVGAAGWRWWKRRGTRGTSVAPRTPSARPEGDEPVAVGRHPPRRRVRMHRRTPVRPPTQRLG